jgi:hypothetical protein
MRPTFRKLEVKDIGSLERLVAENAEGVEPGLKIVDSRLLLGQAAIDLVGLDSKGSLVLIALDFSADDGLLLRVMDAYSWCLEYPDTLRRLYPMAQSSSRPPRILFILEKMTDAFARRIKQLSFLEIDCFEYRHLEVNGASVVYFDLVERLRKIVESTNGDQPHSSPTPIAAAAAPLAAAPAVAPAWEVANVAPVVERPVEPVKVQPVKVEPVKSEPVKAAIEWPRPEAPSEPPRVDPPKAVAVSVAPSAPDPVVKPKIVEIPTPPAVSEFQSVNLVGATAPAPQPAPAPVATVTSAEPALALEAIQNTSTLAPKNGHASEPAAALVIETTSQVSAPVFEEPIVAAPAVVAAPTLIEEPVVPPVVVAPPVIAAPPVIVAPPVVVPEPVPAPAPAAPAPIAAPAAPAPAVQAPVWAKPIAQPASGRQFFAQSAKSAAPVEAPAMVAAVAATAEPASQPAASKVGLEVDDRPELESLSFPKDGLSRQWLEFLSQLGATK